MSPGWDDLRAELAAQEERFWKRHVSDVKAGKPIDQRELDRALGKLDGIRALLGVPAKAAATVLRDKQEQEDDGA
jgi:hypothetical protein